MRNKKKGKERKVANFCFSKFMIAWIEKESGCHSAQR